MKMRKLIGIAIALAFAVLLSRVPANAAACTCTYSTSTSTTSTVKSQWVNCGTSATACTLTDIFYNNGQTFAKHLEFLNSCAHALTIAVNGSAAVSSKGDVLQVGERQVYDVSNSPCINAQPGPTCSNLIPHGTFSILNNSGTDTGCFNIFEY